ncbi:MAG: glutathione peroxidase [bacterium]|jgi:glutathione peroxidase
MNRINRRRWLQMSVAAPLGAWLTHSSLSAAQTTGSTAQETSNIAVCQPLLSHRIRPLMAPVERPLCDLFAGDVLLMVNTASKCGFTPQFKQLEKLHQHYADRGFQVLGFPSDDFRQELSTEKEVAEFCELNYGVSFPMFQKVGVKSDHAHPLFHDLAKAVGTYPRWNFNKYLINRDGRVIKHYDSNVLPLSSQLVKDIEALL